VCQLPVVQSQATPDRDGCSCYVACKVTFDILNAGLPFAFSNLAIERALIIVTCQSSQASADVRGSMADARRQPERQFFAADDQPAIPRRESGSHDVSRVPDGH
jgi:hypothetical protein